MRYALPKTVRKDYIKSVTTHADLWCERCRGQRLVFGRINNFIDELMSCEDCDLCSLLNTIVCFVSRVCFGLTHYLC